MLAVPNVSEGRDQAVIDAIAQAFEAGEARLLDVHSDPDHNRSVFTVAGQPGSLAAAVLAGAQEILARVNMTRHEGQHPRVGALDVAPLVYTRAEERGTAFAEGLVLADGLGELGIPVYLYGELGGGRTRADLRRPGGLEQHRPDFGPPQPHPTAGATLVAAREPLIAFNVEIDGTLEDAKAIAARLREGGVDGLPGVRALGLWLRSRERAQISTNLEHTTTPQQLLDAIAAHARVTATELVALAPERAFQDWRGETPLKGFDPQRHLIERALS